MKLKPISRLGKNTCNSHQTFFSLKIASNLITCANVTHPSLIGVLQGLGCKSVVSLLPEASLSVSPLLALTEVQLLVNVWVWK